MESEIVSHEPLIESVANTAHHMVKKEHYAAREVQEKLDHLQGQLQDLKDMAAQRKARLLDAVESQMVGHRYACIIVIIDQEMQCTMLDYCTASSDLKATHRSCQ